MSELRQVDKRTISDAAPGTSGRDTVCSKPRTSAATTTTRGDRKGPTVSWYGRLAIIATLLLAAGWEIFRLLMTVVTLD
jgi:hypothetical protein